MDYKKDITYWRFINASVRFVGFVFFIVGIGFGISGIGYILNPNASIYAHYVVNVDDFMFKLLTSFVSLVCMLVGFLAMKLEPYYPKHLKDMM